MFLAAAFERASENTNKTETKSPRVGLSRGGKSHSDAVVAVAAAKEGKLIHCHKRTRARGGDREKERHGTGSSVVKQIATT